MSENPKLITRKEWKEKVTNKAREDADFKKSLMEKPHEAIAGLGVRVPEEVEIKVVEESAGLVYLVLPANPEELTDEQLDGVAGGWSPLCPCWGEQENVDPEDGNTNITL